MSPSFWLLLIATALFGMLPVFWAWRFTLSYWSKLRSTTFNDAYQPSAAVILPLRGLDPSLVPCLRGLLRQNICTLQRAYRGRQPMRSGMGRGSRRACRRLPGERERARQRAKRDPPCVQPQGRVRNCRRSLNLGTKKLSAFLMPIPSPRRIGSPPWSHRSMIAPSAPRPACAGSRRMRPDWGILCGISIMPAPLPKCTLSTFPGAVHWRSGGIR